MRAALASWHMGRVIHAYRTHPRHRRTLSQELVAGWLGLTQAKLSHLENGRAPEQLSKLIHYSRVLAIPVDLLWFDRPGEPRHPAPHSLRTNAAPSSAPTAAMDVDTALLRELEWLLAEPPLLPQARAGRASEELAGSSEGRDGQPRWLDDVIGGRDVHVLISGALAPDGRIVLVPVHRRDFLRALGLMAASGATLSPLSTLATVPAASASLDPRVVDHLARLRAVLAENDNLFGPRQVIAAAQEQTGLLATHLRHGTSSTPQRQTLHHIQTQFADLLGWLHQDSGDHAAAGYWLDRALEWSHRAGDPKATVFILARKSQLAADRGDPGEAIDVAEAALTSAEPTGRLAAIAATYSAHGHALRGEKTTCLTLYDRAHDILDRAEPDTDPWGQFFSPAYIEVQRAHSLAALGDYPAAATSFRTAIDGLPSTFHRDRGVYLAREALAHAGAREPEQAATLGLHALMVGTQTHSGRIMTSLRSLHDAVAGWRTVPQVREFRQAMGQVPTATVT
ncbi:helix-turn-helix domain-containing protein [Frankia sp. Cj5]|uniref:helix-turn-helix domain-containing protein n=1 Tax=Frankia sp. Cj5 TaxID=2880978 RepID=UPI001EF54D1A|nr:helix-turn-helix transcriptional regulator [Frankia sp. Cj5]